MSVTQNEGGRNLSISRSYCFYAACLTSYEIGVMLLVFAFFANIAKTDFGTNRFLYMQIPQFGL